MVSLFKLNKGKVSIARIAILPTIVLLASALIYDIQQSYAHFDHRPHYNGREDRIGPIVVFQALNPEYAAPGEPVSIEFSIQDRDGNDLYNIATMIEIYEASSEERVYAFPWTEREIGDFTTLYTFPRPGNYYIVMSVDNGPVNLNQVDPPRGILSSTSGCNCYRSVFTVNISGSFGVAWSAATYVALVAPVALLGAVLASTYKKRSRMGTMPKQELLKYSVMLAALAGGTVHLAVFPDHALLRLEYSIFLLSAAGAQVAYGLFYTIMSLTADVPSRDRSDIISLKARYRKTQIVNLIGLAGSCVLLGLYAYAIIFPPPLSPNDRPEDVEFVGVLAKALEVFLVGGVLYMMKWEKEKLHKQLAQIR